MKLKIFTTLFLFFPIFLSCKKDVGIPQNSENSFKVDTAFLEIAWEKPLDSNLQKIKIYPFPVGDNIIHTYDFGLSQLLVYRNGKTGEEIKRIHYDNLIYPTNAKVYDNKLVYGTVKSIIVLADIMAENFKYLYVNEPQRLLNERFNMYNDIIVTNEDTFQAGDSLDRIILANVSSRKSYTVYSHKKNTSRNYFFRNPQIWVDEVGDTMLTVGRELINYASAPANLLSYNVSKDRLLFDRTFPYNTENVYEDFICYKNKILLKKDVLGVTCIDAKTGNSIWSHTIYEARLGGQQMFLFGDYLIIHSPAPNKRLLCFNADNGTVLWTNNDVPFFNDDTKMIMIGNFIYFGKGDYIYGFDKITGSLLRKQKVTDSENHLISNISYSETNKLIYVIDSSFIKALRIK